ncbi:MAG: hypothetical protein ACRC62_25505, partial [Microcoleus sp.]
MELPSIKGFRTRLNRFTLFVAIDYQLSTINSQLKRAGAGVHERPQTQICNRALFEFEVEPYKSKDDRLSTINSQLSTYPAENPLKYPSTDFD